MFLTAQPAELCKVVLPRSCECANFPCYFSEIIFRFVGSTIMGIPTVEKFLCCCQLKTGVLIIGAINLVIITLADIWIIINTIMMASRPCPKKMKRNGSIFLISLQCETWYITLVQIGALLGVLGSGMSLGGLSVVASGVLDDLDLEGQELQQARQWCWQNCHDGLDRDIINLRMAIGAWLDYLGLEICCCS